MKHLFAVALAGLYISCLSQPAHAYLDPNVGSMLLQGILAGMAAAGLVIKTYWYRITAFFKGAKDESNSTDTQLDTELDDPPP